ncbi:hypothetical protein [Streptomyces sp. NPDC002851]
MTQGRTGGTRAAHSRAAGTHRAALGPTAAGTHRAALSTTAATGPLGTPRTTDGTPLANGTPRTTRPRISGATGATG